jgi:hypothetical protein
MSRRTTTSAIDLVTPLERVLIPGQGAPLSGAAQFWSSLVIGTALTELGASLGESGRSSAAPSALASLTSRSRTVTIDEALESPTLARPGWVSTSTSIGTTSATTTGVSPDGHED